MVTNKVIFMVVFNLLASGGAVSNTFHFKSNIQEMDKSKVLCKLC